VHGGGHSAHGKGSRRLVLAPQLGAMPNETPIRLDAVCAVYFPLMHSGCVAGARAWTAKARDLGVAHGCAETEAKACHRLSEQVRPCV